jgi:twinkle protein
MSNIQKRKACEVCRANGGDTKGDNLVVYSNGNEYCFVCKKIYKRGDQSVNIDNSNSYSSTSDSTTRPSIALAGEYKDLELRKISEKTCRANNYMVAQWGKTQVEICNYIEDGQIYQKIRKPDKTFQWEGRNGKKLHMYGMHNKYDYSKPIYLVEGEIDMLSMYELGHQALSLTDGAGSAKDNLEYDYDEITKFNEIVLFFDNDKEGKKALDVASQILPLEKLKTVKEYYGYKDANDLLRAGLGNKIKPEVYTPDGVLFGNSLKKERLLEKREAGLQLPWPELTKKIRGLRKGKLIVLGAGSNCGKTPVLREIGFFLRTTYPDLKIANIYLEEDQVDSPLSYLAMHFNIPVDDFIQEPLKYVTEEQFDEAYDHFLNNDRIMFTDIQYDLDSKKLLKTLEYLGNIKKFDVVLLDHISMVIAASESQEGERRDIDILMKNLRSVIRKTGITVIAASHLSNPDKGLDWEEGREVRQKDFRGSGSIRQIPDVLLGLERNMKNPYEKDKSVLRIVKNRGYGSDVGVADELHYNSRTGRLQTIEDIFGQPTETEQDLAEFEQPINDEISED